MAGDFKDLYLKIKDSTSFIVKCAYQYPSPHDRLGEGLKALCCSVVEWQGVKGVKGVWENTIKRDDFVNLKNFLKILHTFHHYPVLLTVNYFGITLHYTFHYTLHPRRSES